MLKGKDPYQILADLERLDRMEYDVDNPPVLNEKVLKDKRRKLKETWDRICRLYVSSSSRCFETKVVFVEQRGQANVWRVETNRGRL